MDYVRVISVIRLERLRVFKFEFNIQTSRRIHLFYSDYKRKKNIRTIKRLNLRAE